MRTKRRSTSQTEATASWCLRTSRGLMEPPPQSCDRDSAGLRAALVAHRGWASLARHGSAVSGLPPEILEEAQARLREAVQKQLLVEADLLACGRALDAARIPWVCVKGPVLAEVYRQRGETRLYNDLDLLVSPRRFAEAIEVITAQGGGLISRNFRLMREVVPGEVALRGPLGTLIDLHWSLVNRPSRRDRVRVSTEDLLRSAVPVAVSWSAVPSLPAEEALVHLCLHAALSGATRLSWLLDITLWIDDCPIDWDRVVAVAREWAVAPGVGVVLRRARRLLEADVPREVVVSLMGRRGWGVAEAAAERLAPVPSSHGNDLSWEVAVGSTRSRTAVGMVARRLAERARTRTPHRRFVQHPDDPGSTLHAAGDRADLQAYLDAVAAQPA